MQVVDIYIVIHCQYTVCYSSCYMIVSTEISIERFDSSLYNYQKKDNSIIDDHFIIRIYCKQYKSTKSQKLNCASKNKSFE